MISSIHGASHGSSLEAEVEALLPRACQRLLDSQHLELSTKSVVQPAIRQYMYGFAADPAYRHLFGSFKFPEEVDLDKTPNLPVENKGDEEEEDDDDDDEDEDEESWTLSGAQSKAEGSGLSSDYLPSRKGKPCGHVFKKGESVYRCKECGLDDSCVLCAKCYKASDHEGHEVSFSIHTGGCGCCDCGDHEAWRKDVHCAYHHPDVPYPTGLANTSITQADSSPQQAVSLPTIPTELRDLIRERIREAADFAIYAVSQFPRETAAPAEAKIVAKIRPRCRWVPGRESSDDEPFSGPWSVILWNDEKHTYQEVIEILMSSVRCSHERALASAVCVDNYGFEIVASSTDATRAWDIARRIGQTSLGVTVCATEDAVVLDCLGHLLDWLQDIAKVHIAGDETYIGRIVAEVLLSNDRLQVLLKNEDKLWKRARSTIRAILMSLLVVGQDVKLELARAYSDAYPALVSAYLLSDREPDNSVTQFSVQLFSAPSVARYLVVERSFLRVVTSLLYAFFTQQVSPYTKPRTLQIPPRKHIGGPIDPESPLFKHKKYYFMFQDLHHLLFHSSVQQHLVTNDDMSFSDIIDFLHLFDGMNPQIRSSTTHIEYETDSWVAAFNLMIHLSKLAKNVGKAFHCNFEPSEPPQGYFDSLETRQRYLHALYYDVLFYLRDSLPADPDGSRPVVTHPVTFNGKQWDVIKFKVSKGEISFHHPIHLLYTEMLKNVDAWSPDAVREATSGVHSDYANMIAALNEDGRNYVLRLIDEVVRVLALLAQIRSGLWVRNGFGLRAQHLHYREYSLRESTFDQDVFFLQAAFVSVDPSLLLVNILDRFEILPTIDPASTEANQSSSLVYDKTQAVTIIEELLYMFIVVFSEPSDIEMMSAEDVVRRELIHVLLMGPYSYSEIIKNVTDRASEETFFDKILAEVATFRAPDPTVVSSDVGGTYALKEGFYKDIDPYYYRFTRNQREQAMKTVKEKSKNEGNFQPRKMHPRGQFASPRFFGILATSEFVEIIRRCLAWGTRDISQYADVVIDLCLHLIKIALTEVPIVFAETFVQSPALKILSTLEEVEHFKEQQVRIVSILETLTEHKPEAVKAVRIPKSTSITDVPGGSEAELLEKKRQAAKARQAAIMQQFAAAQQSFLDTVSDDEDEEDEDEGAMKGIQAAEEDIENDHMEGDRKYDSVHAKRQKFASMGSCIVCQEDLNASTPFGSLALIQTSSFVRKSQHSRLFQGEMFEMPRDWDKSAEHLRPFGIAGRETTDSEGRGGTANGFPCSTKRGLFASACGHMMHISCFTTYCQSIASRHASQFTRLHPENPERNEFICPLCKSLGNVLLPVSEDELEEAMPPPAVAPGLSDRWLQGVMAAVSADTPELAHALSLLTSDGKGRLKIWRIAASLPHGSTHLNLSAVRPSERKMLERLLSVVSPLEAENRMLGSPRESRSPTISHQLVSYTLAVIEIGLRGKETGTLHSESLPASTVKLLRSLLASLQNLARVGQRASSGTGLARTAILWLMFGRRYGQTKQHQPFLCQDPLTILIQAAAITPDDFYQIVNLCFYAHMLRVSYELCRPGSQATVSATSTLSSDETCLAELCMSIQEARWNRQGRVVQDSDRQTAHVGSQHVFYHAMPFLRRAAILHGIVFPSYRPHTTSSDSSELTRLLDTLRITHPSEVVGRRHGKSVERTTSLSSVMEAWDASWLAFEKDADILNVSQLKKVDLEHPVIYELLGLPKSIDTLVESTVSRKCKRCKTVPSDPAICLICGELVCQQSYCCMDQDFGSEPTHGECNTHMWKCGTSMGIYFLIKRCGIIYLYADKGTFATAPYLDVHGEADPGFRKHRPLFLNKARYDEVRKLWLNHTVATLVARKLDSTTDPGGWNTF